MTLTRRQFSALAASAMTAPWAHAQQPQPANLASLYEAAKKERELTWYIVFLPSEDAETMARAFTARYPGVKVNVVRTTAQVAFQRLNQDLKARTANCDVFSSTDIGHYVDLKARKLLTKYTPASAALMDSRLQNLDADGYYHAASAFMVGLVYNSNKVKAAEAPTSWMDLADPKWRGLASVGHPGFSGAVGTWCIEMRKLYGDGWFKKLALNKPQVGRSIIDTVTTVNSGERSISAGPVNLAALTASKGNPLAVSAPKEGPVLIVSPSAIMANAPHPNASKLFMEWMLVSEDADRITTQLYGIPRRAGARPLPGVLGLGDVKTVLQPTAKESVDQLPEVIDLWKDAFGV
ncbi:MULTISPECIES: ABC transporter substrate-binding protein [Variovorax]|jgi:iron(III) transport system substrate-binding protein|uniref:ABC transporter substrate-binding protein n=1 Tax=Variovorax TaxID=34072 RepID=UPI0008690CE5|nr:MULTISPECIES: extracellular solute-binding protein [Variovorax]MBN8754602.1 extracellular solute-binding protein [Variovorax sp.]ODU19327.1 MAG: ABC transporter substrate-binding protein [Variovorax sp. SCN 67-85]ODV25229.1 MAG: ABC transporter substrate-binding protein [Variovorax sp. SCN 67-20]OJZ03048.1 MAG: ABC transporter substrate-binding protein [Variovorax sp. 67-131]UKI08124.1 extracellular solute-binding protein [Variovorax paradoxus]